jgi:hypothetical protein
MTIKSMLGVILFLGFLGAIGWVVWQAYCSTSCEKALSEANRLAAQNELHKALEAIDAADATCNCAQFTEGDEPPEYSTARDLLGRMRVIHGDAAAAEFVDNASGPIIQELGAD